MNFAKGKCKGNLYVSEIKAVAVKILIFELEYKTQTGFTSVLSAIDLICVSL